MESPSSLLSIAGRIVYRRALSKKLVFYDLVPDKDQCDIPGLEVVVKEGGELTVEHVRDLRDAVKVGDLVLVQGTLEACGHTLLASSLQVLQPWKHEQPGKTFTPKPLPRSRSAQSAQQPTQQVLTAGKRFWKSEHKEVCGNIQDRESPYGPQACDSLDGQQVCKFWINTGTCPKGDACLYAHINGEAASRVNLPPLDRLDRQRQAAGLSCNASRKSRRAAVFADWLVSTYGRAYLQSGSGVLDVAGGRGALAFQLQAVHGIRCTLIDPRPFKLSREQHRILQGLHSSVAGRHEMAAEAPDACGTGSSREVPNQIMALFDEQLWSSKEHAELLGGCSLVVGLHPDEATEPIVDFSLARRKPFAVVPCCVFPRLFPDRRLQAKGGTEEESVISYSQFLTYLQAKCKRMQTCTMSFEGRSQVLFAPV